MSSATRHKCEPPGKPKALASVRAVEIKTAAIVVAEAFLLVAGADGQLATRNLGEGVTPEQMAGTLVGRGVRVFNVQYTGATNASGLFCSGDGIVGFENGLLLTSGEAAHVVGPNTHPAITKDNALDGDAELDALIPGFETFDASVLSFDFIPEGDEVRFRYVFSSEEYNEFVDSPFNDVFGFFVNGTNFALIPGASIAVAINNLNNGNAASGRAASGRCMNCEFYIDNANLENPVRNTQMDGLTTVLTMIAPVRRGQLNRMKIAIADAGDRLLDSAVFIEAGSFISGESTGCVTRTARFWFTHPDGADPDCVTLRRAIERIVLLNCDQVPLGFLALPIGFHTDDNVRDADDALIEALGLAWRSNRKTGEAAGTQSQNLSGSQLCRYRKELAVELLAALANVHLLGTDPVNCPDFPSDLLRRARMAAAGERVEEIRAMTATLRRFNASGAVNQLPDGFLECSALPRKTLQQMGRDPTTQNTCPGENDTCQTAEAVLFPDTGDPFSRAEFKRSVDLRKFRDSFAGSSCGAGGRDAAWRILPTVGVEGRRFTVDTFGSNFDTMVSVWRGDCDALVPVDCNDDAGLSEQSQLSFTTDGTSTYLIVVEGPSGQYGKLKLRITSP